MNFTITFPYLRHLLVVALGIILFYVLASKHKQITQYFQNAVPATSTEGQIFTEAQLLKYNGKDSEGLYLVILGHVYDVTKGAKHYGEGEAYHMFIGHDATRSFVTGEFGEYSDELSDVSSLTESELQQLFTWKEFYDKTYIFRGKAVGRYFDQKGEATAYYRQVEARAAKAVEHEDNGATYPSCNVEWKRETGTRVWCTNRSGDGLERQWVGFPRKVIPSEDGGGDESRRSIQYCACVPENVSDDGYVPFSGCENTAVSCVIPDEM